MENYVKVAVDLPVKQVNKPFTYHLPEELKGNLRVGHKVKVPFGNRRIEGYVLGETGQVDFETKPILEVVSPYRLFNEELLKVARWMANYYQCYLITALKAIVPSGEQKVKTKRVVRLAQSLEETEQIIEQIQSRAPKQAAVLSYLVEHPNANLIMTELATEVDTTSGTVRRLKEKGLISYQWLEVKRNPYRATDFVQTEPLEPTIEQKVAIKEISTALAEANAKTFLLKGITGSGKTEVYLQVIAEALARGQQAIVLVPEISLTPQTIARFKGRFGEEVAVLHSQLSTGERFDEWRKIKAGEVKIAVGARSAVFAPFEDLGIIIIDEEHETSYKQGDHPKYHAREVAVKRAELNGAVTVLGTATPSLEAYYRAQTGDYQLLELPTRIDDRPLPPVEVVDMREELKAENRSMFSKLLQEKLARTLERNEQSIIFLNRRGFSTFVQCRECGHVMECEACDVSLTYHAQSNLLQCHYCDHKERNPDICPACESRYIKYFGLGTQKVEEQLGELFPEANTLRMDVDTTRRKGAYQQILSDFKRGKADILLGTQMVAKGHDFANVTLVGVITADTSLNFPDFRAGERTFQLLTQVAGRTGRGDKAGEVVVQSYTPEHYSIQLAKEHDYESFYDYEIEQRKGCLYPPYSHLINIIVAGEEEERVIKIANQLGVIINSDLHNLDSEEVMLLGPVPAPLSKLKGEFRWQLILKGAELEELRQVSEESLEQLRDEESVETVRVSVDVDPIGML
ncbi:primosomal protein N' [Natroniella sulfidigena]|uniref:primosomal protein N' n=1 Tax=Natroniella sulfidigena TaxID=723921 RepID=UPI00200AE1BD|nr:primosomal protein N' [Natroniella sulfidigena]MCK8817824.1 primosomal protein N' [Natroniella sulfidigena]